METGPSSTPGQTRRPPRNSLPAAMLASSPITAPSRTAPLSTRAPRPRTLPLTWAPAATVAPSKSTLPATVAPGPIVAPAPTAVPPVTLAPASIRAPGSTSASPDGPGTAGEARRPSTRSHEPRTKASGVPTSSQYALSTYPITVWPDSIRSGKVSRSTDTTRPGGISSMARRAYT